MMAEGGEKWPIWEGPVTRRVASCRRCPTSPLGSVQNCKPTWHILHVATLLLCDVRTPSVVHTVQRRMIRWLLNNETERMWNNSPRGLIWGAIPEFAWMEWVKPLRGIRTSSSWTSWMWMHLLDRSFLHSDSSRDANNILIVLMTVTSITAPETHGPWGSRFSFIRVQASTSELQVTTS